MAANQGLIDVLTRAYATDWLDSRLHDLVTGPLRRMVTRGQEAGVVRPDVDATDIAVLLPMLTSAAELAPRTPRATQRYLSLVLAGLRPADAPLVGRPPTDAELHAVIESRPGHPRQTQHKAR
jgi:hypothetical protein